jgi:agmatine deiminase
LRQLFIYFIKPQKTQKIKMQTKNYIKYALLGLVNLLLITRVNAQQNLPVGFSKEELQKLDNPTYTFPDYAPQGITTPPTSPVRNMAQWEEIQALTIAWVTYPSVLKEIVRAAEKETTVIINATSSASVNTIKNTLTSAGIPLTNVKFNVAAFNSVWIRDFMANSCYTNDVDSLILVDWKYNRPRPDDDALPQSIAKFVDVPLYETTTGATALTHTGGNYMSDGLHTAFSSKLVLNENSSKSEATIDQIMDDFMGINRYIKMTTLPYDGIHHIDMHMKLLNEETLLVGEYPKGIADGPQIEANIQYVLSNFKSVFGTPYKIIRIPQPPDQQNGNKYPDSKGSYLTYTNSSIINKTIIVPQYYEKYDTTALRIFRQAMPGYNVVGISSYSTIDASGSLHCMTHSIGTTDPLLIVHQNLPNTDNSTTPYEVNARIQHRSGIKTATIYYTSDLNTPYSTAPMTLSNVSTNTWTGHIPAYLPGTRVYYYIEANANSGKKQVRPMPAPKGYFSFIVTGITAISENEPAFTMKPAFPNPSKGITCIPFSCNRSMTGTIKLMDIAGKEVETIFEGTMEAGEKNYFVNTIHLNAGVYFIATETNQGRYIQKLMVK